MQSFNENFSLPEYIYKPKGCEKCNFTGYKKRTVVGELFIINDEVKSLIAQNASEIELKALMQKQSKRIKDNLLELVLEGKTSLQEAIRVGLKD